jgi:hypothetical protein
MSAKVQTRRGFFGACVAAVGAMLVPAAKAAGVDDVLCWPSKIVPGMKEVRWRGHIVLVGYMAEPRHWFMSDINDPNNFTPRSHDRPWLRERARVLRECVGHHYAVGESE